MENFIFCAVELTQIKNNLNEDEILIYLDYSKNYKCQHHNEIHSAYFDKKTFIFFTACTYYNQNEKNSKFIHYVNHGGERQVSRSVQ